MWKLKNNTNECVCKTETNKYRKQASGYQRGERGTNEEYRLTDKNVYTEN